MIYSTTARIAGFGSHKSARRVSGLTPEERRVVRTGADEVRISGCPEVKGQTDRVVIYCNGRFYCRMPIETD